MFHVPSRAQDSTRVKRIEYVVGATLGFALVDYVAYNLIRQHEGWPGNFNVGIGYRLIQGTVQAAISYFLYKNFGLPSAISFNLIWWTWGDDLAYYGWGKVVNPLFSWSNSGPLLSNHITWAGWTPVGIFRTQGSVIAPSTLYAQAIIGFSVSLAILW